MKRTISLLLILLLSTAYLTSGQSFITPDDEPVNGYSRKISGLDFDYHSCIPGLRQSILIRADSGKDFMEWETGAAPKVNKRKYAAFIWVTAIGSSPGNAKMTLTTSQGHEFVFSTDGRSSWTIGSDDGASLSFNSIMTDQQGDHHGYMILRIPSARVITGKLLSIKVTGSKANLTSWYMTYKKEVKTGVTLNTFPAILKKDNAHLQLVEAAIFYFGRETEAEIYVDRKPVSKTLLKFGYNSVNAGLPQVSKPTRVIVKVAAGEFTMSEPVILSPVRKWTMNLIQHSHTDIGYTRSQTEILAEHLRYIDYALDYCDATDNYPDNAKFRWTCEASWPVDEYLKCRPSSQIERLQRRIREGRIEVTGMYFNFDEIPDEQILAASLAAAGRIREKGIPVNLAMQNDVNGAAASLIANMGALSMASLAGIEVPEEASVKIDLANEALLFYTEHTSGYSESVREPYSLPTMEQRALKESYAWEANRRTASLGEEAMGLLQSKFTRETEPSLIVFNTLNWKRSGLAVVYIDHQLIPGGSTAAIYERDGTRIPAQALSSRSDGTYWAIWLSNIPSFGFKKFLVRPLKEDDTGISKDVSGVLENKWYKIVTDPVKGTITSWYDKELSLELVDRDSEYGMGEFILEQLGNRSQMESRKLVDFKRFPLDSVRLSSMSYGPLFNSIKFTAESRTAIAPGGYTYEIRLFNTAKHVELACTIIKKSIITPESFYIAFPFKLADARHFTEVQGGTIETGKDQIKGSSNDWYSVQNFTSLRNQGAQIVMGCGEMPLMQFGAINTGRYQAGAMPQGPHIFSWPMNNYWVTNFNADQRGGHTWTYYLTSSSDASNSFATQFGWGSRVPFLTRILPGEGTGDNNWEGSLINGWPSDVILISARPAGDGKSVLIHLRETGGKEASIGLSSGLSGKPLTIREADVTGKQVQNSRNVLNPFGSGFFVISNGM